MQIDRCNWYCVLSATTPLAVYKKRFGEIRSHLSFFSAPFWQYLQQLPAMNDLVEEGKAKAAGIISILIGVCALIELICGFIYLSKGGPEGSGLWSGVGVNNYWYFL